MLSSLAGRAPSSDEGKSPRGVTPGGIAYDVQGSGPPLLWMAGYAMSASSLENVVARFANRYTCIKFDHRGSGRSQAPLTPLTTRRMARDAEAVLDHLGVESAHVYGASLGGMVAQELAIHAPHRVRTLVLGGTTSGGIEAESPSLAALLSGLCQAGRAIPGRYRVGVLGAVQQGWAAATHDSTSRLHLIQAPTLVVHGSKDWLVPASNAETLARLIPRADLRVLRGAGHLFIFESPTATRVVMSWLDARHSAGASGPRRPQETLRDFAMTQLRLAGAQTLPIRRVVTGGPHGSHQPKAEQLRRAPRAE